VTSILGDAPEGEEGTKMYRTKRKGTQSGGFYIGEMLNTKTLKYKIDLALRLGRKFSSAESRRGGE